MHRLIFFIIDKSGDCLLINDLRNGIELEWLNSKIQRKTNWLNGNRNGKEIYLNENSQILHEINWLNNKHHGKDIWWYKNGKKWEEIMWLNDKKHGKELGWYSDGIK